MVLVAAGSFLKGFSAARAMGGLRVLSAPPKAGGNCPAHSFPSYRMQKVFALSWLPGSACAMGVKGSQAGVTGNMQTPVQRSLHFNDLLAGVRHAFASCALHKRRTV
jgi:hypothetical protein